jgi:hypothetical protein
VRFSVVTEKIATKTHFGNINAKEGVFYDEIVRVLPFIGLSLPEPTNNEAETLKAIKKNDQKIHHVQGWYSWKASCVCERISQAARRRIRLMLTLQTRPKMKSCKSLYEQTNQSN